MKNQDDLSSNFSETGFWQKLSGYAKQAGREVVEKALWMYFAAQNPQTPAWARSVILGALAYFILPLDAIPDMLPGIGYSDDLGVLAAAFAAVSVYITADVKKQAADKIEAWFG
ncbi:MAG: hypothetical protein CVV16_04015 [Gammaproteobacteria bacterium HGW-Gammaproteobacteria-6]|nr:MAG: hypothetical protein CVV16_04015 [Gammaproteobacteria bacterium HGW-Gammaproteobacteria-6]